MRKSCTPQFHERPLRSRLWTRKRFRTQENDRPLVRRHLVQFRPAFSSEPTNLTHDYVSNQFLSPLPGSQNSAMRSAKLALLSTVLSIESNSLLVKFMYRSVDSLQKSARNERGCVRGSFHRARANLQMNFRPMPLCTLPGKFCGARFQKSTTGEKRIF